MLAKIKSYLPKLHSNRRGDIPVSTLLIVGAVVLPLVFFLIGFKDDVEEWVNGRSQEVIGEDSNNPFDGGF